MPGQCFLAGGGISAQPWRTAWLVETRARKPSPAQSAARAKATGGNCHGSHLSGDILYCLLDPAPGYYRPGSFLAPTATGEKKNTPGASFPGVDSWTVSSPELAQIRKARPGEAGVGGPDPRGSAAWPAAPGAPGLRNTSASISGIAAAPSPRAAGAWPTGARANGDGGRGACPAPDVTQGPRTEPSRPRPQSLQWL